MVQAGETFDFTAGKVPHTAFGLVDVEAAGRAIREVMQAGGGLSVEVLAGLDQRLREAVGDGAVALSAGERGHLQADAAACLVVRDAFASLFYVYRVVAGSVPAAIPGAVRCGADLVFWECAIQAKSADFVWSELFEHFERAAAGFDLVTGDIHGLARDYLRAVAFDVSALDQLDLPAALAAMRVIELTLPFLALSRGAERVAAYSVSGSDGGRPRRFAAKLTPGAWSFSWTEAVTFLRDLLLVLDEGVLPPPLRGGALDLDEFRLAVRHLLRHWSLEPPVRRFRRHLVDGKLSVVRGLRDIQQLLAGASAFRQMEWSINDLSRGGVGATTVMGGNEMLPRRGELLSFRPQDGANWHLGIVRRVRHDEGRIVIGIETLSPRPVLMRVDDGRTPCDVFFCDPVQKGEAVRIAAPASTLRPGVPLFVSADNRLQKLKPLDQLAGDAGIELRVYQVL